MIGAHTSFKLKGIPNKANQAIVSFENPSSVIQMAKEEPVKARGSAFAKPIKAKAENRNVLKIRAPIKDKILSWEGSFRQFSCNKLATSPLQPV